MLVNVTRIAHADLAQGRYVVIDAATGTAKYCGAGLKPYGVTLESVDEGEPVSICVLGTCLVEAGAAVAGTTAYVQSDANGRAIPLDAGVESGLVFDGKGAPAPAGALNAVLQIVFK